MTALQTAPTSSRATDRQAAIRAAARDLAAVTAQLEDLVGQALDVGDRAPLLLHFREAHALVAQAAAARARLGRCTA